MFSRPSRAYRSAEQIPTALDFVGGGDDDVFGFALCIRNEGADDLEPRKVYEVRPDELAAQDGYLRVVDESGEDYLYPAAYFVLLALPHEAEVALLAATL